MKYPSVFGRRQLQHKVCPQLQPSSQRVVQLSHSLHHERRGTSPCHNPANSSCRPRGGDHGRGEYENLCQQQPRRTYRNRPACVDVRAITSVPILIYLLIVQANVFEDYESFDDMGLREELLVST